MTPRQARVGVDIFTGVVVASVGVALAGLTWRLLGDPGTRYGAAPVAARPVESVDLAPIIAAAPFGTGGATAGTDAPMTNQPLVLRGIVLASSRAASTALIQIGDAPPAAFAVGQVAGAATIEAIERDRVVLIAGGKRQILAFPQKPDRDGTSTPIPAAAPSTPVIAPPPPPLSAGGSAAAFLQNLGAAPNGEGFRVNNGSSIGRLAGLQPGDQIERINGRAVADLARDPNAYAAISATGAARLELVRGGQRLTLIVPLR